MLFLLNVSEDNNLLQQVAFTTDEVKSLLENHNSAATPSLVPSNRQQLGCHQSPTGSQQVHPQYAPPSSQSGSQQVQQPGTFQCTQQSSIYNSGGSIPQHVQQSYIQPGNQRPDTFQCTHQSSAQPGNRQVHSHLYRVQQQSTVEPYSHVFQKHPEYQQPQLWKLCYKKKPGRYPVCAGCRKECFSDNDLHITVKALYVPQNTEVCVERVYYFCVDLRCISHKQIGSNLSTPPSSVEVDGSSVI